MAAVEFALVLPLLVLLLFVIVNGGLIYLDRLHLQSAARDAARIASVAPDEACTSALNTLSGNDVGSTSCRLVQNCSRGVAEIRLTATQNVEIPLIGRKEVTLNATSSFVCEP